MEYIKNATNSALTYTGLDTKENVKKNGKKYAIVAGTAAAVTAVGGAAVYAGSAAALKIAGFGAAGIKKASLGAWLMSLSGGATKAGGLVATMQSAGALGISKFTAGAVALSGWFTKKAVDQTVSAQKPSEKESL